MIPTNKSLKDRQMVKFSIAVAVLFLVSFLMAYFVFGTPQKIYKQTALRCDDLVNQHESISVVARDLTENLDDMLAVESARRKNPESGLDTMSETFKLKIQKGIDDLSRDSVKWSKSVLGNDYSYFINAFRAVVFLKELTNTSVSTPQITPPSADRGDNDLQLIISNLQKDNAQLKATIAAGNKGQPTNSGTDFKPMYEAEKLKSQALAEQIAILKRPNSGIADLQRALVAAENKIKELDVQATADTKEIAGLKEKLKTADSKRIDPNEEEKAKIMFQVVEKITAEKGSNDPIERLCRGLRKVLIEIQASHPRKAEVQAKMSEVTKILCKI